MLAVAPFTGAWIEISCSAPLHDFARRSLPSRERGLKFRLTTCWRQCRSVAPFTGAWIEIQVAMTAVAASNVAPFTGAWIEIVPQSIRAHTLIVAPFTGAWIEISAAKEKVAGFFSSLPSRERGLKSIRWICGRGRLRVAPFTGAWIEI